MESCFVSIFPSSIKLTFLVNLKYNNCNSKMSPQGCITFVCDYNTVLSSRVKNFKSRVCLFLHVALHGIHYVIGSPPWRIVVLRLSNLPSWNLRHDGCLLFLQFLFPHNVFAIGLILQKGDESVAFLTLKQFLFGSLLVSGSQSGETPKDGDRSSEENLPTLWAAVSLYELEGLKCKWLFVLTKATVWYQVRDTLK